jgi:hypothetical protein
MEFSGETTYDAPLDAVFAVETDPDEYQARFEEAGDRDMEMLECGPDGDGFVVVNRRVVSVELPGFARKVLSPTNTITHTVRFDPEADGKRRGTFEIEVHGAPVRTEGTILFEDVGGGKTRHRVEAELHVKVPLVGGKIANWAKDDALAQLETEFAYTRRRLAERAS